MRLSSTSQFSSSSNKNSSNFNSFPTSSNPGAAAAAYNIAAGTDRLPELSYIGGQDHPYQAATPPTGGGKLTTTPSPAHLHLLQADRNNLPMPFPSSPLLERINLLFPALHRNPLYVGGGGYSPFLFPGFVAPPRPLPGLADPAKKPPSFEVDMPKFPTAAVHDQFPALRAFPLPTWPSPHAFSDALRRYAETAAQHFQQIKEAYMSSMEGAVMTSSSAAHHQLVAKPPLNLAPAAHHSSYEETAKLLHHHHHRHHHLDVPSTSALHHDACKMMTSSSGSVAGVGKSKFLVSPSSSSSASSVANMESPSSSSASLSPSRIRQPKTHRCVYCGKLYSRKYGLKIHIRTHTGYKPLKCKVCGRPFGDPSNLNKHVRLHAKGQTPYKCDLCGKVLVRRRDLDRHMKSRHSAAASGGGGGGQSSASASPSSRSSPPYWSMEKSACRDVIMEDSS